MNTYLEWMLADLDKTTVDGFAEALLICLSAAKDKEGRLLGLRLSEDPAQNIECAKQVAKMMLGGEK